MNYSETKQLQEEAKVAFSHEFAIKRWYFVNGCWQRVASYTPEPYTQYKFTFSDAFYTLEDLYEMHSEDIPPRGKL